MPSVTFEWRGHRLHRELSNEQGLLWVKININTVWNKAHIDTLAEVSCRLANQTSNRMSNFSNIYLQQEWWNCFLSSENSAAWFPIAFCTVLQWQNKFSSPDICPVSIFSLSVFPTLLYIFSLWPCTLCSQDTSDFPVHPLITSYMRSGICWSICYFLAGKRPNRMEN